MKNLKEIFNETDYKINGNYEKFTRKTKIKILHTTCGNEFLTDIDHWERGQRCPFCNKYSQKKSNEDFLKKIEEKQPGKYTILSNYINKRTKVKVKCNKCGSIFESLPANLYKGICLECSKNKKKELYRKNINEVNNEFEPEYTVLEYEGNKTPIRVRHNKCGNEFIVSTTNLRGGAHCPFCFSSASEKEKEMFDFILSLFPDTKKEKFLINTDKHKYYEIDAFIPSMNIGFEFNGLYWHSEKFLDKNYHLEKMLFFKNKSIRLVQIFEDEWDNKKEIVKDKIKTILGKNNSEVIYARKCKIKEIDKKTKKDFLEENHIQGNDKSNYDLGLFFNERLVSVMTFCFARKALGQKNKNEIVELSRFASLLGCRIPGGFSKLLKYAIERYSFKDIITYADLRWSSEDKNVYTSSGFFYKDHISKPSYFYTKNFKKREFRYTYRKNNLKSKFKDIYNEKDTEKEIMKKAGFFRIFDCGNIVFKLKR